METSIAQRIELRVATPADLPDIARIIARPPEPPVAAWLGTERGARCIELLVRGGLIVAIESTTVATLDGAVVGVMDCGSQYAMSITPRRLLWVVPWLLPIVLPILSRGIQGLRARARVQFDRVPGAFSVAELYVDAACRGRGIGGRLLSHADELAAVRGLTRMCLETGITNPARRLYDRHGYAVVETKTDAAYERLTGSPGRILMVKKLRPPAQR